MNNQKVERVDHQNGSIRVTKRKQDNVKIAEEPTKRKRGKVQNEKNEKALTVMNRKTWSYDHRPVPKGKYPVLLQVPNTQKPK